MFPPTMERYIEPFVGGGAVFFALRSQGRLCDDVLLADSNEELINAFRAVRDSLDGLLELLVGLGKRHSRAHYYEVRSQPYEPGVRGAARTIYLNKTGFNGLYRVNSRGGFNVPMGRYHNPNVVSEPVLRAASKALQGVELKAQSFESSLAETTRQTFCYLDPPYVPLTSTANFTGYRPGGFGPAAQEQLAACTREIDARGGGFILSNSYTQPVLRLYEGFRIRKVSASRAINCVPGRRGPVFEAIVTNR